MDRDSRIRTLATMLHRFDGISREDAINLIVKLPPEKRRRLRRDLFKIHVQKHGAWDRPIPTIGPQQDEWSKPR